MTSPRSFLAFEYNAPQFQFFIEPNYSRVHNETLIIHTPQPQFPSRLELCQHVTEKTNFTFTAPLGVERVFKVSKNVVSKTVPRCLCRGNESISALCLSIEVSPCVGRKAVRRIVAALPRLDVLRLGYQEDTDRNEFTL